MTDQNKFNLSPMRKELIKCVSAGSEKALKIIYIFMTQKATNFDASLKWCLDRGIVGDQFCQFFEKEVEGSLLELNATITGDNEGKKRPLYYGKDYK